MSEEIPKPKRVSPLETQIDKQIKAAEKREVGKPWTPQRLLNAILGGTYNDEFEKEESF